MIKMADGGKSEYQKVEEARLEKLFHSLDADGDGKVNLEELMHGLRKLGYTHVTDEQIREFLDKSDVSNTGDVDVDEFVQYLKQHEKQLQIVFNLLDENKDGKLCINEIIAAFKQMGIVINKHEAEKLKWRSVYFIYLV